MAKPHAVLAVQKLVAGQRIPTQREILELAEMTSYSFNVPSAAALKTHLKEMVEVYRDWLQYKQQQKDAGYQASLEKDEQGYDRVAYGVGAQRSLPGPETLTFFFSLIFTCPQILSRSDGFEWVLQDLEKVLVSRRLDPESDRAFATAVNKARSRSRVGPPKDKALDYFRYGTINELMNPSVVIPGVTLQLRKTKAVEFVSEMETRLFKGEGGVRSIWTSYKRVARFLQQLTDRVRAESSLAPPPTKKVNGEPEPRAKNTSKRSRRSPRQKRVRRK